MDWLKRKEGDDYSQEKVIIMAAGGNMNKGERKKEEN